jgi:hypothetical protein
MAGAQSTQQITSPHGKNAIVDSTSRHILHNLCTCMTALFRRFGTDTLIKKKVAELN